MIKNELNGETYNPAIAAASNFIGQKLFAYISHGKNINDRIREKFKKSLIFIGDEGQIYQPLTNTYIGIGQTAYTAAITYIEEAHDKIDALNKMLTSSMVTSIYANWGKDTWDKLASVSYSGLDENNPSNYRPGKFKADLNSETFESLLPTKVYATNDIILRGIGDYDPNTKLAYTHETAHIIDSNIQPNENGTYSAIDKAKKSVLEGSFLVNDNKKAFATSGITVSLEKGLNRYMFTYTFTTPDLIPGASDSIWTETDYKVSQKTSSWSKSITVYFTKDDITRLLEDPRKQYHFEDYDGIVPDLVGTATRIDAKTLEQESIAPYDAFFAGLRPVYEDGFGLKYTDDGKKFKAPTQSWFNSWLNNPDNEGKSINEAWDDEHIDKASTIWEFWTDSFWLNHQLFKQGKNTISIDDKLTWSYISSAYSYALDFSKEYTDTQVERIYKELLGETSTTLIPVGFEQVVVQVVKDDAVRDLDHVAMTWDETNGVWKSTASNSTASGDSIPDDSSKLAEYRLNEGSIYVRSFNLPDKTELDSNLVNTSVAAIGEGTEVTVLPWFVLVKAAKEVENYVRDYKIAYSLQPKLLPDGVNGGYKIDAHLAPTGTTTGNLSEYNRGDGFFTYAENYTQLINLAFKHIGTISWKYYDPDTGSYTYDNVKTSVNFGDVDLNNIVFMGYERDTDYKNILDPETNTPLLDDHDFSNWPNKDYVRKDDTIIGGRNDEEVAKDNDFYSKYDNKDGNGPYNPKDGQFGLPAGKPWGDENTIHDYRGKKYSLTVVYKIIDNLIEDLLADAEGNYDTNKGFLTKSDVKDYFPNSSNLDLYVVNTKWSPMTDINLADGIQTLKEVAYVLDIITDGWGNHYEDGEGNGILLTYTIANNHDRIVDHERRLKAIESGENVVKGIGKLDYLTSKFVNMTITSDVLWQFRYLDNNGKIPALNTLLKDGAEEIPVAALNKDDKDSEQAAAVEKGFNTEIWNPERILTGNFGFDESADWLGFWDTDHQGAFAYDSSLGGDIYDTKYSIKISQIPTSYIITYNTMMKAFVTDQKYRNSGLLTEENTGEDYARPVWEDICEGLRGVGTLTVNDDRYRETSSPGKNSTYIFETPDARYMAIHSYVGHVGIGIDLKLAQTYTITKNIHNGTSATGFVSVDLQSPLLKKKVNVYAYLPAPVETNPEISYFEGYDDKRYIVGDNTLTLNLTDVKDLSTFKTEQRVDLLYGSYDDNTTDRGLLVERLLEMGIIYYNEDSSYNFSNIESITFVQDKDKYHDKASFEFEYVINVNDAVIDANKAEYTGRLYTDDLENPLLKDVYPAADAGVKIDKALLVISSTESPRLFLRYIATKNALAVDLTTEGLTTTYWVSAYVTSTVETVKDELKKVEIESYRYAETLIKSLDSNYVAERGKTVIGISQHNGIVKPILGDLPKDEFTASYVVWGENSGTKRKYIALTNEDIDNEFLTSGFEKRDDNQIITAIAKDYPLYVPVSGVHDYILVTNPKDIEELNSTEPIAGGKMQGNYQAIGEKHNFIITTADLYTINEKNEYKAIGHDYNTEQIISSWKAGFDYELYIPLFFQTQSYQRIDGAQLRKVDDDWVITVNDIEYSVGAGEVFYSEVENPERKYISAKVTQHTAKDGGNGGNSMEVTAHITKLADATQHNSGLVDAYDVRETLDNMFEWVDLSLWDEDKDAPNVNPINTLSNEQGGYRDAASNMINAQQMNSSVYPLNYFNDHEIINNKGQLTDKMINWYVKETGNTKEQIRNGEF